ncbi:hypothetical protein HBH48_217960 [Parastagonospora nodorum]|nr:hypothetical protein HBH48_217960 [Parastagonospora nodorum]
MRKGRPCWTKGPNILSLIAFIISYRLFADKLLVYVTIRNLSCEAQRRRLIPSTLLARFIPTTKIRDPLLKILLTSVKKNCYCTRCTKHYNFNIHVSLATDTLHLLLKGLVIKMLDFMQDMLDDIYSGTVVSLLFVLKAPFALHFIRAVCDLVTLAQYKRALERMNVFKEEFRVALDSICTRANSEAHYITIVKQFYSITNKKEVIRPLLFRRLRWLIPGIQPHSTKLPLSEVAANIAISDFIYAAAVFVSRMSVQIHSSIKCWRFSGKRHNDSKHCDEEVSRTVTDGRVVAQLYLILIIIDYTCYDKDGKYMAYIRAFSETLQAFKFYDLSTIIRLVHLVSRDLPDSITRTTMSYYVNNYIN